MSRAPALIASLLLGGVLVWQWHDWRTPLPAPSPRATVTERADEPLAARLAPPPRTHYAEVLERPLFRPDRRPPPPPAPVQASAEQRQAAIALERLTLTTVLITPRQRAAWVRIADDGGDSQRVEVGDRLGDWTVSAIHPEHLLLERQGRADRLPLRDFTRPGAAPATAPGGPGPRPSPSSRP
ncbi:type II secretion system protein N [Marichromatium gracile]|uniref:Type II secretion system protein GspC N-terminal domain-containing protein n=1 Tax=Marichromatium gracile TaxID=1048 RepID=A0ABR5VL45_MARGR|nr:type II secretion system protein N [Marichromatium gracile]KXX64953.1 hypothetical protein AY586_12175 [Marichromatium gracile]